VPLPVRESEGEWERGREGGGREGDKARKEERDRERRR